MSDAQIEIRRWITSIDQTRRIFGPHRPEQEPEVPTKRIAHGVTDTELEAKLEELVNELDINWSLPVAFSKEFSLVFFAEPFVARACHCVPFAAFAFLSFWR